MQTARLGTIGVIVLVPVQVSLHRKLIVELGYLGVRLDSRHLRVDFLLTLSPINFEGLVEIFLVAHEE